MVIINRVYDFQIRRAGKWNKESLLNLGSERGKKKEYRKRGVKKRGESTKCNRRNKSKYIDHKQTYTRMYIDV